MLINRKITIYFYLIRASVHFSPCPVTLKLWGGVGGGGGGGGGGGACVLANKICQTVFVITVRYIISKFFWLFFRIYYLNLSI